MSRIDEIVQKAISDPSFRARLRSDPAKALRGWSLTQEETAAITSNDASKLSALGVDQRMSKVFAAPDAGQHSMVSTGDVSGAAHASLTSTGDAAYASEAANFRGDPDFIFSSGDDTPLANIPTYRGDPDYVPGTTGETDATVTDAGPVDPPWAVEGHTGTDTALDAGSGGAASQPGSSEVNEIQP